MTARFQFKKPHIDWTRLNFLTKLISKFRKKSSPPAMGSEPEAGTLTRLERNQSESGQTRTLLDTFRRPSVENWKELTRSFHNLAAKKVNWSGIAKSLPKGLEKLEDLSKNPDQLKTPSLILALLIVSFFSADLVMLLVEKMIPEPPTIRGNYGSGAVVQRPTVDAFDIIISRNLFNSKGLIPGEELSPEQQPVVRPEDIPPTKTSLPLDLIGTVIFRDEMRSLATIQSRENGSIVYPVRVGDEVPKRIRISKIEPRKVTFLNFETNRYEFVELPEDNILMPGQKTAGAGIGRPQAPSPQAVDKKPGVEKLSGSRFLVSRTEIDATLKDFNKVLTEARAVPNFENGIPSGYKLFQIVPGSIYDKIGLKNGDVISGINGEPINDPAKAFSLITELKTSNHLELKIKRDGKERAVQYDIQ